MCLLLHHYDLYIVALSLASSPHITARYVSCRIKERLPYQQKEQDYQVVQLQQALGKCISRLDCPVEDGAKVHKRDENAGLHLDLIE
jgi:hypothetical protein